MSVPLKKIPTSEILMDDVPQDLIHRKGGGGGGGGEFVVAENFAEVVSKGKRFCLYSFIS